LKISNIIGEKKSFLLSLIFSICFIAYCLYNSLNFPSHDYANSYFGAKFFISGKFDKSIFDPFTFNKKIAEDGHKNIFVSYSPNPPFTSLFFVPFALLPLGISKFVFNLISSFLFLLATFRLTSHLNQKKALIFALIPIAFFVPIRNEILFGQTYFLIYFLLVEGYIAYSKNQKWLSAFLWALAISIKIVPIIVFVYLIARKDWKVLFYSISFCVTFLIVSILLQGFDVWHFYFTKVLPKNSNGDISIAYLTNYQSAHMLFKFLFLGNIDLNPAPFISSELLYKSSLVAFNSLVFTACVSLIQIRKEALSFGLVIIAGLLLSPYGSTYQNLLLLIIMIASAKELITNGFVFTLIVITFTSNIPISLFKSLPVVFQFPRLLLFVILIIGLLYFSKSFFQWRICLVFACLFSFTLFLQNKKVIDNSTLLFKDQNHILLFDYYAEGNYLAYKYWTEKGSSVLKSELTINSLDSSNLRITNNQIFYKDKQLTHTEDVKLKPKLLNNEAVLYLSDKDKGIGFYSLRKIKLDHDI
jgi:Glycosyltransferase family 87